MIKNKGMGYEKVTPHMHCRNLGERAIQSFKDIFVGVLRSFPSSFPWLLWDNLIPQVEMNINILRKSNMALTILSYAHLNGLHNNN